MANISEGNRKREREKELAPSTWRELIVAGFDARLFNRVNVTETRVVVSAPFRSGSISESLRAATLHPLQPSRL